MVTYIRFATSLWLEIGLPTDQEWDNQNLPKIVFQKKKIFPKKIQGNFLFEEKNVKNHEILLKSIFSTQGIFFPQPSRYPWGRWAKLL